MYTFKHLTLKCDLGDSNQIISLCTSSHNCDHLCKVISKFFHQFKSYGVTTQKCYGQTDGLTDGGHTYNPLPAKRKGINMPTDVQI
jgi:hypothetical protein